MSDITNNEENAEVEVTEAPVAEVVVDETPASDEGEVTEAPVAEVVVDEAPASEEVEVTEAAVTPVAAEPVVAEPVVAEERKGPVIKSPVAKETSVAVAPTDEGRVNPRKVREGIVVSNKMDMTLVVAVNERVRHPRYGKTVQRTKKLYVHDENNDAKVGDRVRVQETRPLSKLKRWRLTDVVERAR
ncbi:MAG: 30S ribosomal protein S17 [Acidobacteria bacterium]|nr:30S ribosomal protein S17 [Acidobacteriota bacterium]